MKKARVDSRKSGEVRCDDYSRASSRVEEESVFEWLEALLLSDEGMGVQERGLGREVIVDRAQGSVTMGSLNRACGLRLQSQSMGLKLKGVVAEFAGSEAGLSKRWALDGAGPTPDLDGARLVKPMAQAKVRSPQEKDCLLDCRIASNGSLSEGEYLVYWETEELRKQQEKAILLATNKALVEEAMSYASGLKIKGKMVYGSSHLIPYSFDWAPEGKSYDHFGVLGEKTEVGLGEDGNGCWDLVEFTNASNMVRGVEWDSDMSKPHDIRSEKEDRWEESSLAKFSHFLGFSTEGLEKEILSFLIKIRKRWKRIHSKELLEKSKFERELKRLECSVNNEKRNKQKGPSHGKEDQIAVD